MSLITLLGLIGGACFAVAAVPSALRAIETGHNPGVPVSLAWLVFSGTVLVYTYLVFRFFLHTGIDWVLSFNYFVEAWSWSTILLFHYFPRRVTNG